MKVVFLNPTAILGGAERVLLNLLQTLARDHPVVKPILLTGENGELCEAARRLGVETETLPFPARLSALGDASFGSLAGGAHARSNLLLQSLEAAPDLLRYLKLLSAALKRHAPQIIHSNGFKMHLCGALTKPRNSKLIWHLHDHASARPLMARGLKHLSSRADATIAVSRSVAQDFRALLNPQAQAKVAAIYNGINLADFTPAGTVANLDANRDLPPVTDDVLRVGLVATYARWKGHETFLRALSLLAPDIPVRGYVIGGAVYRTRGSQYEISELQRIARELGVERRVVFTGHLTNTAAAMRVLDIVVHASTQPEPFGLVIAEAMACERAVVGSRAGGAAEIMREGVNALTHEPGDAAGLARQIERLMRDANLRRKLGANGRQTVSENFTVERMTQAVHDVYQKISKTQ